MKSERLRERREGAARSAARVPLVAAGVLLASASLADTAPPRPYAPSMRVLHIKGAMLALTEAPRETIQQGMEYAKVLARGACSAGAQRLRVECLMIAMQRYCRDKGEADAPRCRLYMDVLASNVLADERLIPPERRYRIMRDNKDYRRALAHELRRIQASIAFDFRMDTGEAEDVDNLSINIDRYCNATADESNLPYQTCVSSLVWFIKGPK